MPNFNGQLNANEIFSTMFNMLISQQVFADNIDRDEDALVSSARVDGTLHGDTKLYYATDILKTHAWGNDAEAVNLLALDRPEPPKAQAIVLNIFRQIRLTVDNYLSKRFWMDEGAFSSFNSVMLGWLGDTKYIYDETIYNSFIGTTKTTIGAQNQTITLTSLGTGANKNATASARALEIGEKIANIFVAMNKPNRNYNDYGFMRKIGKSKCKIIMNSKYANEIKYIDLPTIFHTDGVVPEMEMMSEEYFGDVNTSAGTVSTSADNTTIRALVEKDYTVDSVTTHVIAGELLPKGASYLANETYTQNSKVICKIIGKLPPYMSAFQVQTVFVNPRSLTENNYLTFGHNTLEHFANYPFVTLSEA